MTKNPIEKAEFSHQRYVINKSRSGRLWILLAVIMLLPAVLTSLLMFGGTLLGYVFPPPFTTSEVQTFGEGLLLLGQMMLVTMNIALYLVVMLVSFALAANSINREKENGTWDILLLTNVSARKLVMGKWRGSLRAMNGDFVIIGLLRMGLVAWLLTGFLFPNIFRAVQGLPPLPPLSPLDVLGMCVLVLCFTFLDTLMNLALALLAVLLGLPSSVTFPIFIGLRGLMVYFWLWWVVNTANVILYGNGSAIGFGVGGLLLYAGMVAAVLRLAEFAAVYGSNASPENELRVSSPDSASP